VELPVRPTNDVFTQPGGFVDLRARVRRLAEGLDIPSVVVYAFDSRTRMLPFIFADRLMVPAGVRVIGSTLHDCGLPNTRLVLQQWTPNVKPSQARLGGRPPEMLLISSMQIHAEAAYDLVTDACRLPPGHRPLIIAGGPKAIYEPWDLFSVRGDQRISIDVAVCGEAFVFAELLEVLTDYRRHTGSMREAFEHARREGALESIMGLVYKPEAQVNGARQLIRTGTQRIVRDLDELPFALDGFRSLEPPHKRTELSSTPIPLDRVSRYAPIAPIVMTQGCKFHCDFCPIPAVNQRTFRNKSGQRLADEWKAIRFQTGIRYMFGTCDNFFNDRKRAEEILTVLARTQWGPKALRRYIRWGTESTQFDAYKSMDILRLARNAGMRAVWFGIEDLTGALVRKGQGAEQAKILFKQLDEIGICPMPMMVHHDNQPLLSRGSLAGLLNQVVFLRNAGAISMQITMLTPSAGSRSYEKVYEDGMVIRSAGGHPVQEWQIDGNNVVSTRSKSPWLVQLRMLAGYIMFYNPVQWLWGLVHPRRKLFLADILVQSAGMYALARTAAKQLRWALQLWWGPIVRYTSSPEQSYTLVSPSEVSRPEPLREKTEARNPSLTS